MIFFKDVRPNRGDGQGEVFNGVLEEGFGVLTKVEATIRQIRLLLNLFTNIIIEDQQQGDTDA